MRITEILFSRLFLIITSVIILLLLYKIFCRTLCTCDHFYAQRLRVLVNLLTKKLGSIT